MLTIFCGCDKLILLSAGFVAAAVGAIRSRSPVNILMSGVIGGTVITAVDFFTSK